MKVVAEDTVETEDLVAEDTEGEDEVALEVPDHLDQRQSK